MNLTHVPSRECVIIGTGKIPKNEIQQVAKEISALSDNVVWSYKYLQSDDENVPRPVFTQLTAISDPDAATFIAYDIVLRSNPEFIGYGWVVRSTSGSTRRTT